MAGQSLTGYSDMDDILHKTFLRVAEIENDPRYKNGEGAKSGATALYKEKQTRVLKELNQTKEAADDTCQSLLREQRKAVRGKEEISVEIIKHFSGLRDKINKFLYKQEQEYLNELEQEHTEKESEYEDAISWCRSLLKTMEHDSHLIDHIAINEQLGEEKGKALGNAFDQVIEKLQACGKTISTIKRPQNLKKFIPDTAAEKQILSTNLGKWEEPESAGVKSEKGAEGPIPATMPAHTEPLRYAEFVTTLETRLEADARKSSIGGLAWTRNRILAVDRYNKKLKLLDERGAVLSNIVLIGGDPWDVAMGEDVKAISFAYVTIPNDRVIMIIRIPGLYPTLELGGRISTRTGYCCISYDKKSKQLVCGCCSPFGPPRVDILGTDGVCTQSFALDPLGKPLFSFPRSIDVADGIITVCDWNKNRLIFLTNEGFIVSSYKGSHETPLLDPMGTTLDGKGHVMVADCKSNVIHIIKVAGEYVGTLDVNVRLTGPREISCQYDSQSDVYKLAVSYGASVIEIFHLSKGRPPSAPEPYDEYYDDDDYGGGPPPPYDEKPTSKNHNRYGKNEATTV